MNLLDHATAKALFDYRDGQLYWKEQSNRKHDITGPAGTLNVTGYIVVTYKGKKYGAHRVIWVWHGNELPEQLDHINRNKADNRIENLRASDYQTNQFNTARKVDNKSGERGVSWCNTTQKWIVQIYAFKKKTTGRFNQFADAVAFARSKRAELHGDFACLEVSHV